MGEFMLPKWTRELKRFLSIKPQFFFWGNIYDVYPISISGNVTTLKLTDYLRAILTDEGYSVILHYEPIFGFSNLAGTPDQVFNAIGEKIEPGKSFKCTLTTASDLIARSVYNKKEPSIIILNFSSRLPDIAKQEIDEFNYLMFHLCHSAEPRLMINSEIPRYNSVIWILDKENDSPAWYTVNNPKAKTIPIPKPDHLMRKVIIEALSRNISGFSDMDLNKREENTSVFVDQTGNLYAGEIISIVALARQEHLTYLEITEAIRRYKLGIIENPWTKLDLKKIGQSESILGKRVKGQDQAIKKVSDIIKRSIFNLSGSQYSKYSNRPKGVLFFAGPTGVGKTELAKAITEMIFGSDTSYIRFDMTEFRHEHADQRLVGSPPGYVGYDVGGELTNAIKENPFSVVLFDEIEKAHPRILDIFMQMIDDGRLTSGRGDTVYFTECLIIFTSNLGIYEVGADGRESQNVDPTMDYPTIQTKMLNSIEHYFKYKISRPEILNRIGDNIVVFDFIREKISQQIFDKMITNVLEKVQDSNKISLELSPEAKNKLANLCCSELSMGGRGIGNKLENVFINPLSRSLFELNAQSNSKILITDIVEFDNRWEIRLSPMK